MELVIWKTLAIVTMFIVIFYMLRSRHKLNQLLQEISIIRKLLFIWASSFAEDPKVIRMRLDEVMSKYATTSSKRRRFTDVTEDLQKIIR